MKEIKVGDIVDGYEVLEIDYKVNDFVIRKEGHKGGSTRIALVKQVDDKIVFHA
jgi:hypothetical protein